MPPSHRTGPETPRLRHRAMTVDDAEAFFALDSHPDVMRFTGEPPLESWRFVIDNPRVGAQA